MLILSLCLDLHMYCQGVCCHAERALLSHSWPCQSLEVMPAWLGCHRLAWTQAVCCSDKSTFSSRQWGSDSLGSVYHSAVSLTASCLLCFLSLSLPLVLSRPLKSWAHVHQAAFKRPAHLDFTEAASLNTGCYSVIKLGVMWLLVLMCHC